MGGRKLRTKSRVKDALKISSLLGDAENPPCLWGVALTCCIDPTTSDPLAPAQGLSGLNPPILLISREKGSQRLGAPGRVPLHVAIVASC